MNVAGRAMGDVKISLLELKEESDSSWGSTQRLHHRSRSPSLKWIILLLVLLGIVSHAIWFGRTTTQAPQDPSKALPLTSYPGFEKLLPFLRTATRWPSSG